MPSKHTRKTNRKQNRNEDMSTKDLLDTTVKVALLGATVGLIGKLK